MKEFVMGCVGFVLIFIAVDYKRCEDCVMPFFTIDRFVVILLVIIGAVILQRSYKKK